MGTFFKLVKIDISRSSIIKNKKTIGYYGNDGKRIVLTVYYHYHLLGKESYL